VEFGLLMDSMHTCDLVSVWNDCCVFAVCL